MSEQSSTPQATYSPPNSNMAVLSLIAGILGLTLLPAVGSIVAVITGSMAKKEIRSSRGALSGDGLAMAGIILGWIGIALAVVGICLLGLLILLPLLLVALGLSTDTSGMILPALLAAL